MSDWSVEQARREWDQVRRLADKTNYVSWAIHHAEPLLARANALAAHVETLQTECAALGAQVEMLHNVSAAASQTTNCPECGAEFSLPCNKLDIALAAGVRALRSQGETP